MESKPKWPETLFVRYEKSDEDWILLAYEDVKDAIADDGPTEIGAYTLSKTETWVKKVVPK